MRTIKILLLSIICYLLNSLSAFAAKELIDGIYYSLNMSERTAEVADVPSSLKNVVIPEVIYYDGIKYNVTAIGEDAFYSSSIESIKMGNSIKEIKENAFTHAHSLRLIDIGNSVEIIGSFAFSYCSSLKYIVLPASLRSLGHGALWECPNITIISLVRWNNDFTYKEKTVYPEDFFRYQKNQSFQYTGKSPDLNLNVSFEGIGFGFKLKEVKENYSQGIQYKTVCSDVWVPISCTLVNDWMSFEVMLSVFYEIKPVVLKAKVNDAYRLYGDSDPKYTSSYTGFIPNENENVIISHGTYRSTASKQSNVGKYAIKQTGAVAQNYVFEYEDGTLTIDKAPLKMTAKDKTMTYGSSLPTFDAKYEGLKNNETQPTWNTQPTYSTTANRNSRVGRYPITIKNAVAKNYQLTLYDGNLTVEKADLTVGVENKSREYGDANPQFTLYYSGLKNNESTPEWIQSPTFETKANKQSPVGTYSVSISNASATNYNIMPIDGKLTVNKATLQVTPKDATRKYGDDNPKFDLSYLGLKNNESTPEWITAPKITTSATKQSSVGNYDIQVTSGEARNYTLIKKTGTLTITKAPLTSVRVNNYTRKYGEANPNFQLSYTGLLNNETTPVWTEEPVISTAATSKSDVGEYSITAKGGVMKNYEIDRIVSGVLTVTPAPLTINAMNTSKLYYEDNPTLYYLCYGFVDNDDLSVLLNKPQIRTEAKKGSKVGVYPITVGDASAKNYTISYNPGELTIMKRELTVSTKDYTRAYGEENPEFELNYKGFVNNENENVLLVKPKATTIAKSDTDTGVYDIIVGNGAAENYDFTYIGGKLTIEKAYQTLTWNQDLGTINQYDQIELLATASSGLDVTYTIEGNPVCSVVRIGKKQYLDCFGEGEAVIVACQEGNKNYWQTTRAYKSIVIVSPNGIKQLIADKEVVIYDVTGNRIPKLQKGVNIIKMSDGTIKKVMVKNP